MCLQTPQQSESSIEIEIPGLKPKQLKPEVIKELMDPQTGRINPNQGSAREYENCRHIVRSISAYSLHIKERPDHPCMDYAVGNLMHLLFDHGPPPTELATITIPTNGDKSSYPVLISRASSGEVFDPAHHEAQRAAKWLSLLQSQTKVCSFR